MILRTLESIAKKLGISEHQVIVLYAFSRIGLGKYGVVQTMALTNKLVTSFSLSDSAYEETYGAQLVKKGILDESEGAFFDSTEIPNEVSFRSRIDQILARARNGSNEDREGSESKPHVRVRNQARGRGGKKGRSKRAAKGKTR